MLLHHATDIHYAALLRALGHKVKGDTGQECWMDQIDTRHFMYFFWGQFIDGSCITKAGVVD